MQHIRSLACGVAIAALTGVAALAQAVPSTTPPAPQPPAIQAPAQAPARPATSPSQAGTPTDQQITDAVNARIAVLKADLRLNATQQPHWDALETALRDAAVARSKQWLENDAKMRSQREAYRDAMRQWRDEQRGSRDGARTERPTPPERMSDLDAMRQQGEMMAARAAEIRRIADAAGPLYAALDDGQRRMLMSSIRRMGDNVMRASDRMDRDRDRDDRRWERRRWRE